MKATTSHPPAGSVRTQSPKGTPPRKADISSSREDPSSPQASRAAGISERDEFTDEVPVEPQVSRPQLSISRLTVAALAFTVGGAAGFGFRWISEPSPPAVKEFEQAKRIVESMTGQVKSFKNALAQAHRTQSVTEKALADAEKALVELKTRQAADAAERTKAGALRGYGVSRKPVKSMPCDMIGSKEDMAQRLKDCVKAFENLNR
jgi:hypothetical protein